MSPVLSGAAVETALARRIAVAGPALGLQLGDSGAANARALVERMVGASDRDAWLGFVACSGAYPTRPELAGFRRAIALSPADERVAAALASVVDAVGRPGRPLRDIVLVDDPAVVLVDVTFSAANDHNTGVQRVVRSFVPEWVRSGRPVRLVRWSPSGAGYVDLDDVERERVLAWGTARDATAPSAARPASPPIVVPWGCGVFFPEVLQQGESGEAACLAEYAGATIGVLGHDTIPVSSADTVPEVESERFAKFLDVVKHADFLAGVSHSAASEFEGFVHTLSAQGLSGPRVVAVPNAVEVPLVARAVEAPTAVLGDLPVVLCVGSHEPRKNQEAVFAAAKALFREGVAFRMVFVGGGGLQQTAAFDVDVARWQKRGMPVESHRRLPDSQLWLLYKQARFTVLLSLHEGFGLPVAESVALGTPVLTSNYGSLAEVAAAGGCLTVDPRDDEQILAGMRSMLEDDELVGRLRAEARSAPTRTWAQFADELWSAYRAGAEGRQ